MSEAKSEPGEGYFKPGRFHPSPASRSCRSLGTLSHKGRGDPRVLAPVCDLHQPLPRFRSNCIRLRPFAHAEGVSRISRARRISIIRTDQIEPS